MEILISSIDGISPKHSNWYPHVLFLEVHTRLLCRQHRSTIMPLMVNRMFLVAITVFVLLHDSLLDEGWLARGPVRRSSSVRYWSSEVNRSVPRRLDYLVPGSLREIVHDTILT
eukprot:scaffold1048_cov59-Attheya_sp.AAC.7